MKSVASTSAAEMPRSATGWRVNADALLSMQDVGIKLPHAGEAMKP
jgi:hypothetical protein